ncbi:MAG: hypothetical protein ABJB40_08855 [Acidobacteriota bacterium]
MKRIICLTTLLFLASMVVLADIARPKPEKAPTQKRSIETGMSIKLDPDAKEARLIIPKSQIKQLRAELDKLNDDSDNTAAVTTLGGLSRTQTIASGTFLSLALVFGGMWFVRSGKAGTKTGKGLVILAVAAGFASAATLVYANAGPPAEARSITGKMFTEAVHMYRSGWGTVKLEAGDQEQIQLIVPDPQDKPKSDE